MLNSGSHREPMQVDEERSDMRPFGLIENQSCCCILDHLQWFDCTSRKANQKGVAIVEARDDHSLYQELSSILGQVWSDFSNVI